MGIERKGVWATWQTLAPGHYVEGMGSTPVQPPGTHPPLVELLAFEGRPHAKIEAALNAAGESLVASLGLSPGNVFVRFDEARSGRVYDGGSIVR